MSDAVELIGQPSSLPPLVPASYHNYSIYCVTGSSNPDLASRIGEYLNLDVTRITNTFADKEIFAYFPESIRGKDVYIINSISPPDVNKHLMETLIMIDAAKRASAQRVTAVIPYYGYARQDRKDKARTPISAKLVADLLTASGVDRVVAMELHNLSIQGFFSSNVPLDLIYSCNIFSTHLQKQPYFEDIVIVSPDIGGVGRAREVAGLLNTTLAVIDKRRPKPNVSEVMNIIGDVAGKVCVLIDDICDTAGTLTKAAAALVEHGAGRVFACISHPVLSHPASERIVESCIEKLVVINTIRISDEVKEQLGDKLEVLCCSKLVGKAIEVIHFEASMSTNLDRSELIV
ncbi:hypothetical protein GEMRC1_001608 [Eukaryota sp. GEM-RC1]